MKDVYVTLRTFRGKDPFIKDLDKLEPKGVREEVLKYCQDIAKEKKIKSLREWAGLDETTQDKGRGMSF